MTIQPNRARSSRHVSSAVHRLQRITLLAATLAGLLLTFSASSAWGQLPHAQLTSLFPPGGKIGTEFEVTVAGADLDDASQLLFSIPQITATLKMSEPTQLQPKSKPAVGKFTVKIAADTVPGIYEARVISRFGLSNPRAFAVGILDEVVETDNNNSPDKSVEIPVGTTFSGRVDASNYDYLKVPLKAGQRVLLDCVAERSRFADESDAHHAQSGREGTRSRAGYARRRSRARFHGPGRRHLYGESIRCGVWRRR